MIVTPVPRILIITGRPLDLGGQHGHQLQDVHHDPVLGVVEDRRLLVRVDGDDAFGIAHALVMLRRAADAQGQVEPGLDRLARLADQA